MLIHRICRAFTSSSSASSSSQMSMKYFFDSAVDVVPIAGKTNTFKTALGHGWDISGVINGGILTAVANKAIKKTVSPDHPDALSITAHFLNKSNGDFDTEVVTEVLKTSRIYTTSTARVFQNGEEKVRVLAAHGNLELAKGMSRISLKPPVFLPENQCVPLTTFFPTPEGQMRIFERYNLMLDGESLEWLKHENDESEYAENHAEYRGWASFKDNRPIDCDALVFLCDAFPPPIVFARYVRWIPTVDFTVTVRQKPRPDCLKVAVWFRTRNLRNGMVEIDGEIWDGNYLLAHSRQLALVLQPKL